MVDYPVERNDRWFATRDMLRNNLTSRRTWKITDDEVVEYLEELGENKISGADAVLDGFWAVVQSETKPDHNFVLPHFGTFKMKSTARHGWVLGFKLSPNLKMGGSKKSKSAKYLDSPDWIDAYNAGAPVELSLKRRLVVKVAELTGNDLAETHFLLLEFLDFVAWVSRRQDKHRIIFPGTGEWKTIYNTLHFISEVDESAATVEAGRRGFGAEPEMEKLVQEERKPPGCLGFFLGMA